MAEKETKILKKSPLVNRVVCKITQACFSAADDVIDSEVESRKTGKFIKKLLHCCEDMIYDEFSYTAQLPKADNVKLDELPATIETTKEEVRTRDPQAFADTGD
jgi:hypothetical protein